ncbi:efflux RND transporter permease subunit [Naumannella halotolerans]|uniref:HAE1 family hydrophobic/amphiphilic exporter-1 n=1 Tax=Naumannella halotolerans TaxID=993414 RepID=A0A4R7J5D3_9ACTN|nr:efflux RND transporter permease subunit [Naumannella halotolerans]TDT32561.1 HAE1 family hydrophobic/amphiphilic exporter-1 [Naumannella halotolerans]
MRQLTRLSLANRAVIVLLCLTIVGVGLFSAANLRQELQPNINYPAAFISAQYQGASPEVVERDVSEPLETAVRGVSNVTTVTSTSNSGSSMVQVEWEFGVDGTAMRNDLQGAIDQIRSTLPENVDPQVTTVDLNALPVLQYGVSSDMDTDQLAEELDEIVVPALNQISGVGSSQVTGQTVKEVVITLRQDDLDEKKVDPSQIQEVFAAYGAQIPGGQLDDAGRQVNVQIGKTLTSVDEVRDLWLQGTEDPVQLKDVADVEDVATEENSIFRVNGEPALGLQVTKTTDGNTVEVANAVKDALPGLSEQLSAPVEFTIMFDQAPYIEDSIKDLATEGALGLVMAVLVILVFILAVRPTIISALSIPLSLLMALIALYVGGFTLNLFTLAALTISIGRVVDDSIVVIENIERHRDAGEEFGVPMIVKAVGEVAGAIGASTFVTAAVFLPVAVVGGVIGELFRPFALTAAIALIASLIVALTIVPVLAYWFMRPATRPAEPTADELELMGPTKARRRQAQLERFDAKAAKREARAERRIAKAEERQRADTEKIETKLAAKQTALVEKLQAKGSSEAYINASVAKLRSKYPTGNSLADDHDANESRETALQRGYLPILRWTLRHPIVTSIAAVLIFILTIGLTPFLRTDYLGSTGENTLSITQELPAGTDMEETDAKSLPVEEALNANPEVETYSTSITGNTGEVDLLSGGGGANMVTYSVTLNEDADTTAVTNQVREELTAIPDAGEITVNGTGSTTSQELSVQVTGADPEALAEGTRQIEDLMKGLDGLTQVSSDLAEQTQILQVNVDEDAAAGYGMSQGTVGPAIAEAIGGTTLGQMQVNEGEQDVILRSGDPITTKQQLEDLELPVTQKQTADAQQAEQDDITEQQEAEADRQAAETERQADEQEQALIDQQAEMDDQIDEMISQIDEARTAASQASAGTGTGGGGQLPTSPEEAIEAVEEAARAQAEAQAQAQVEAQAQADAQVEALEEQLAQLREQRDELDDQLAEAREQRAESAAATDLQEELTQRSEDLADITGDPIQVKDVAEVEEVSSQAEITRIDSRRSVTVSGLPTGSDLGTITAALTTGLDSVELPDGVTASIGGVAQDQAESFNQLGIAMLVAIAMVYIIMVATFKSLLQPLILLVSIPFAATGAIALLLITQTSLDIAAMIGLLMLIGVVVTNAIVLIDLINKYRAQGASVDDAVIQGARLRLRPILMTAAATICALIPMFLGLTGGGVFISRPLSVVVIGGMISSTLLTLIVVPVLYHLLEAFRERRNRGQTLPRQRPEEDQPTHSLGELFDDGPGTAPAKG